MNLSNKQHSIIKEAVIASYPNEAVIGITKTSAIVLDNIHSDTLYYFMVDSKKFYKHKFIALVHSHTSHQSKQQERLFSYSDIRSPSVADLNTQINMGIEFGICGYDGDNYIPPVFFPDYESDIFDKPFIYGVYDCYRVVKAWYYQNKGIKLIDKPRDFDSKTISSLIDVYNDFGFYEIDKSVQLVEGDVITMKIGSTFDNHVSLYIGDGNILHHLTNRMPVVEQYSKWNGKISKHLRYKNEKH